MLLLNLTFFCIWILIALYLLCCLTSLLSVSVNFLVIKLSVGCSGYDFYSLSDFVFQFKRKFSTSSQRFSTKFYDSALEAVKDIPSDCKLLVGGKVIFGIEHLLRYNSS